MLSELSALNDLRGKPQENIDGLTKLAVPFCLSHKLPICPIAHAVGMRTTLIIYNTATWKDQILESLIKI